MRSTLRTLEAPLFVRKFAEKEKWKVRHQMKSSRWRSLRTMVELWNWRYPHAMSAPTKRKKELDLGAHLLKRVNDAVVEELAIERD